VLMPVTGENQEVMLALLCKGFDRPREFWTAGIERIRKLGGNAATGVPLGYLELEKDRAVGVILTPACVRNDPQGTSGVIVNLSSWYVAPEHRWRASIMLQSVLRKHAATYTDLTPTIEVRKMLPAFGFKPINRGLVITPLPAAAAGTAAGARVREIDERSAAGLPDSVGALLMRHKEIGCLPLLLEAKGGQQTVLMIRPARRHGMPVARLIYCDSNAALRGGLPAVARFLLSRGMLVMIGDDIGANGGDDAGQRLRFGQFRYASGLKFARLGEGATLDPDRIDHTDSELCCLAH
jgi:hypothetical protein